MNTSQLLVALSVTIAAAELALAAESSFDRELQRLAEQRDQAIAAASAPVNRRYQQSLEQLLGRATQTRDLDAAIRIREAIAALGTNSAGAGAAPAATAPNLSKRVLQRKLEGTRWVGDGTHWVLEFRFQQPGEMTFLKSDGGHGGPIAYRIGDDATVTWMMKGTEQKLIIARDYSELTYGGKPFKRK